MDKEYIDRNSVIEDLMNLEVCIYEDLHMKTEEREERIHGIEEAIYEIKMFEKEDVELVEHGGWLGHGVHNGRVRWTCSNCDCLTYEITPYCPNCGSRMDEVFK